MLEKGLMAGPNKAERGGKGMVMVGWCVCVCEGVCVWWGWGVGVGRWKGQIYAVHHKY